LEEVSLKMDIIELITRILANVLIRLCLTIGMTVMALGVVMLVLIAVGSATLTGFAPVIALIIMTGVVAWLLPIPYIEKPVKILKFDTLEAVKEKTK